MFLTCFCYFLSSLQLCSTTKYSRLVALFLYDPSIHHFSLASWFSFERHMLEMTMCSHRIRGMGGFPSQLFSQKYLRLSLCPAGFSLSFPIPYPYLLFFMLRFLDPKFTGNLRMNTMALKALWVNAAHIQPNTWTLGG